MIVYIEPVAKPRMTKRDVWAKRKCVLRYRAFADELRLKVKFRPEPPFKIIFHISRTKGLSGEAHLKKPDVDNLAKAVLDALWPDNDSHVWSIWVEKLWTTGPSAIEFRQICSARYARVQE